MAWLIEPGLWASLLSLTLLEIVLGIDNLVFIAVFAGRLPAPQRHRAQRTGLALALATRLGLLAAIAWIIGFTRPLFAPFGHPVSLRDLVLVAGGLFLLYKGTREIHHSLEGGGSPGRPLPVAPARPAAAGRASRRPPGCGGSPACPCKAGTARPRPAPDHAAIPGDRTERRAAG